MPKIINAYTGDESIAGSLSDIAKSIFGGNPAQQALIREKALGARRENENIPLLADAVNAGDTAAMTRAGIMAGMDPKFTAGYGQMHDVRTWGPESRQGLVATMAVPGANYGHTMQGTREDFANKRAMAQYQTDRMVALEKLKADNTPAYVKDAEGNPIIVPRSQSFGQRPVLSETDTRGALLSQAYPTFNPEEQKTVLGAVPKGPSNIWTYQTPDGTQGATTDGTTDAQSGVKLPAQTKVMKLEGPNTEGMTSDATVLRGLNEADISTKQAVASIDRLKENLLKPNADQSVGYIGAMARGFNDLRAQAEATARLVGGATAAQTFVDPAFVSAVDRGVDMITGNPTLNQRAQTMAIESAVIRSQIQDLAYTMAKSKDPSGRVSDADVQRATEMVGATLMDPKAGLQVLDNLKNGVISDFQIRERTTRARYPKLFGNQVAPQAPQPAAQPEQWGRDENGNLVRVK